MNEEQKKLKKKRMKRKEKGSEPGLPKYLPQAPEKSKNPTLFLVIK
jgi:hypothetical protein